MVISSGESREIFYRVPKEYFMKIAIRAFVIALTLTGAAASAHISAVAQSSPSKVTMSKASAFPIPTCPPDDPTGCGTAPTVR